MKDLLLDRDSDLSVTENGDICLTDSIRQAIFIRLRWFLGEWKLINLVKPSGKGFIRFAVPGKEGSKAPTCTVSPERFSRR